MKEKLKVASFLSRSLYPLDQNELDLLASTIKKIEPKKGDLLLKEGEIAKYIYWISSGMLRQFYYKNGRDVTEHFACEGQAAICIASMFKKEGSTLLVEAIEDSVIHLMPYDNLIKLSETTPSFANFLRKLLESSLIVSQEKADSWRYETVRERYERFLREYPNAAKRASVNHIASYLLMTPETLSRVRSGSL